MEAWITENQNFENHWPFNPNDGKAIPILEHHAVKEYREVH